MSAGGWLTGKRVAVIVFMITVVAAVPGMLSLRIETDATASFIPRSGPEAEIYERYLRLFPPDFGTVVIATGEVWDAERWEAFVQLAEDLEYLGVVERVIGLPTTEYVVGTGAMVEVEDFVDLEADDGAAREELAVNYEPYQRRLVTENGQAVALYVACKRAVDAITFDEAVTPVIAKYRPIFTEGGRGDLFQSGDQYVSAEIARQTTNSTLILGVSMLIMFAVAALITRSAVGGVLCVGTGVFGVFFTFSLMGYLGITQNSVNALTTNMILPLGTAFTIHAIEYVRRDQRFLFGIVPISAIWPFAFATGSTMLGFGTTAISTVENIQQFGLLGVFGIFACLYTTIFLTFPMMARFGSTRPSSDDETLPRVLSMPLEVSRGPLLATIAVLLVLSVAGFFLTRVNYEAIDYLLPDNEARVNADRGTELFSRHNMPLVFFGNQDGDALDADTWARIRELARDIRTDYPEIKTAWIYDQVKQLSLAFTADEPKPVAMPDSSDLLAQYLLLLEERDVEPYIDTERKHLTLILQIPFRNSTAFRAFREDLAHRVESAGLNGHLTGRQKLFFEVGDRIATQNMQSLGIGLSVLFVVFCVALGSVRMGALAVLVNALPVLGCLAFMGFVGIDLDLGSSIVAAVALGIVVDDTGHMITRYNAHRQEGKPRERAVRLMLREMWRPVTTTTVVIAIGFIVMNFAPLVPFHTFARTLTATMIYALVCDLILLPTLLLHFDRRDFAETLERAQAA